VVVYAMSLGDDPTAAPVTPTLKVSPAPAAEPTLSSGMTHPAPFAEGTATRATTERAWLPVGREETPRAEMLEPEGRRSAPWVTAKGSGTKDGDDGPPRE
jgi:hypothetical protein